jgi:hypothetical protein
MDCNDHSKGGSPLPFVRDIIRLPNNHDSRRLIEPKLPDSGFNFREPKGILPKNSPGHPAKKIIRLMKTIAKPPAGGFRAIVLRDPA